MLKKEIHKARALYGRCEKAISRDNALMDLMGRYRKAIMDTHGMMKEVGILSACAVCANEKPGSCCFEGVEEWYDHVLLLVNLMLGIEVPESRDFPGSCLFVGTGGCKLLARHSFCVNFLCPGLKISIRQSQKEKLTSIAGLELFRGWELEQRIHNWLRLHDVHG